jgi:hypothetical protein
MAGEATRKGVTMRLVVAVLGSVVVLSAVAVSSATAESSDLKLRIDAQAQLVSACAVRLAFSYDCPIGTTDAELRAGVS